MATIKEKIAYCIQVDSWNNIKIAVKNGEKY